MSRFALAASLVRCAIFSMALAGALAGGAWRWLLLPLALVLLAELVRMIRRTMGPHGTKKSVIHGHPAQKDYLGQMLDAGEVIEETEEEVRPSNVFDLRGQQPNHSIVKFSDLPEEVRKTIELTRRQNDDPAFRKRMADAYADKAYGNENKLKAMAQEMEAKDPDLAQRLRDVAKNVRWLQEDHKVWFQFGSQDHKALLDICALVNVVPGHLQDYGALVTLLRNRLDDSAPKGPLKAV